MENGEVTALHNSVALTLANAQQNTLRVCTGYLGC